MPLNDQLMAGKIFEIFLCLGLVYVCTVMNETNFGEPKRIVENRYEQNSTGNSKQNSNRLHIFICEEISFKS